MFRLALANLWNRKIRSGLSLLAVAIGVMMLVVLVSLSRGSVDEVRRRFESVDAEIVVTPPNWDPLNAEGQLVFSDSMAAKLTDEVRAPDGSPVDRTCVV